MSFNQESPKKNFELDTEGWTEVTLPKSSSFRIEPTIITDNNHSPIVNPPIRNSSWVIPD